MKRVWTTPQGQYFTLYRNMLKQPHLLIAGATGSGKSVVINGLVYTALYDSPAAVQFILIDPKRVELVDYKPLPHTVQYASEPGEMVQALEKAIEITESRYKAMQAQRVKKYSGAALYVIIDELADLMTTDRRHVQPLLQRLAQIGRAANVHIIAATQCPLATVIPTPIKVNFDARVALRTRSAQDSRNILGVKGCELLPRYGQGYYMTPDGLTLYNIPMIDQDEMQRILTYWKCQNRTCNFLGNLIKYNIARYKEETTMKKYNVTLSNNSCIFDNSDGFDTIEDAIKFSTGRGGRYVIQIDAGKAEEGEFISITYDSNNKTFSHYNGWGWIKINPKDIKKYINQYI